MKRPLPESWLTAAEMQKAEALIFAFVQSEAFPEEYQELKGGTSVSKSSHLRRLSPTMGDDNVIRLSSRLQNAPTSYAARNPAILPNRHPLVDKLVRHYHELHDHIGEEQIIAALRKRAWIVHVRVAVRRVSRTCAYCIRQRARPRPPRMADLPHSRVNPSKYVFEHTGADVCGPFEVAVGRSVAKRWVLVMVCMTTKAVFLDLLYDLTSDEILQALEELVMTRGKPAHLYSDQGTNFCGANNIYLRDMRRLSEEIGAGAASRYNIELTPPTVHTSGASGSAWCPV